MLDVWKREAPNLAGHAIYRLARDPNDPNRLVAATDIGLFTRSQGFQEDRNWTRVKKGPLDFDADDDKWTTDVLWTAAGRLFVGLIDDTRFSDTGVYVSTHGVDGPFDKVDLDGIDDPRRIRIGLAVAPSDSGRVYVLTSGPKLWRIDGTSGRRIGRVPKLLFGTNDQSEYDLAIAVDPRDSNRIVLGGSAFDVPGNGTSGLLFRAASRPRTAISSSTSRNATRSGLLGIRRTSVSAFTTTCIRPFSWTSRRLSPRISGSRRTAECSGRSTRIGT